MPGLLVASLLPHKAHKSLQFSFSFLSFSLPYMGNKGFIFSLSLFFPNFSSFITRVLFFFLLSTMFLQTHSKKHFWIALLWVPSSPLKQQQMAPGTLCSVSSLGSNPKRTLPQVCRSAHRPIPIFHPH